jgi:hypothetical protein
MDIERIDPTLIQPPPPPEETNTQPPPENTIEVTSTPSQVPETERVVDLLA